MSLSLVSLLTQTESAQNAGSMAHLTGLKGPLALEGHSSWLAGNPSLGNRMNRSTVWGVRGSAFPQDERVGGEEEGGTSTQTSLILITFAVGSMPALHGKIDALSREVSQEALREGVRVSQNLPGSLTAPGGTCSAVWGGPSLQYKE